MKIFSIKGALREGWEMWKQHKKVITIATLISLAVSIFSDIDSKSGFSIIALILTIVSVFIDMGWLKMLLRTAHGQTPKVRDLIDHAHMIWKYLGASIVTILIVIGGLILLVIPGIYWAFKYLFTPMLVLDRNMGIKAALRESARMTDGVKWKLFGFSLVMALVNLVGFLALGVGALVSIPVTTLAFIHVYRKLSHTA
jgi:uncharacterized membrane protein